MFLSVLSHFRILIWAAYELAYPEQRHHVCMFTDGEHLNAICLITGGATLNTKTHVDRGTMFAYPEQRHHVSMFNIPFTYVKFLHTSPSPNYTFISLAHIYLIQHTSTSTYHYHEHVFTHRTYIHTYIHTSLTYAYWEYTQ